MAVLLWGLAAVIAVLAVVRNKYVWLLVAFGVAAFAGILGRDTKSDNALWTAYAADATGFHFRSAPPSEWAHVGAALMEKGLPDCTNGNRLSRTFDAESGVTDLFLARLTAHGYTYESFDSSQILRDGFWEGDYGGGNTVFRAHNSATGHEYFGSWVISWGKGHLFMCEPA